MNNSRDVDEKLTILNLAPLGFWYQLGIAPRELFALQGLGGVFTELNTRGAPQMVTITDGDPGLWADGFQQSGTTDATGTSMSRNQA